MPQQTKGDFDWSAPDTLAAVLILSVLLAIIAALIIYAIHKGYGNDLAQFAQGALKKAQDDARDHYISEKFDQAIGSVAEHAARWLEQIRGFFRAHPAHLPKKWPL